MSSDTYTPGPWFPTKDSRFNDVARVGRAWIIATRLPMSEMGNVDDDAALLAAAPELLEAAQAAWNCIAELPTTQARVEVALMLQAAIAKATRQPDNGV